jgi:hypothetical protein
MRHTKTACHLARAVLLSMTLLVPVAQAAEPNGTMATADKPACTRVSLDWIWTAGMPNGVVDVNSKYVYVVGFGVKEWGGWLAWPTPADRIRIGKDWDTGTPALSYELGNFGDKHIPGVLFVFSTKGLVPPGNLPSDATLIELWAQDPGGTRRFCGVGKTGWRDD